MAFLKKKYKELFVLNSFSYRAKVLTCLAVFGSLLIMAFSCERITGFQREDMSMGEKKEKENYELVSAKLLKLLNADHSRAREVAFDLLDSLEADKITEIEVLKHIGTSFFLEANFAEALNYYSKALFKAEEVNSPGQIADINNNIGLVNRRIGNYKNALMHFTKGKDYYKNLGNIKKTAIAFNNIGLIYKDLENFDKAEEGFKKALEGFSLAKDTIGISSALNNISLLYASKNNPYRAFSNLEKSINLSRRIDNKHSQSISYRIMGEIYLSLGEAKKAINSFSKSIEIAKAISQPYQYGVANLGLSKAYILTGNPNRALEKTKEIKQLANELSNSLLKKQTHKVLSQIYKSQGDYHNGLLHFEKYISIKDDLVNQSMIHQVYDFEMSNLSKANQLQQLELEQKKLTIRNKNNLLWLTIVIFTLGITGLYLFYLNNRNRQKVKLQQTVARLTEKKSHAAVEAEIQERKRIGQELHDCLGQMLSVAGLHISILQQKKDLPEKRKEDLLNAAMESVDEAFAEVRNISHNLAPSLLSEKGLEGALKNLSDQVNQSQKLHMSFETFGLNGKLNSLVENTLFRAIQEILNNTIKHSRASMLSFHITQGANEINLMAEDNGRGFDMEMLNYLNGSGLSHMKTRIENLNGNVHIDSTPLRGTIISIVVPLNPTRNDKRTHQSISG